ncbi:hypothetical protein FOZ63_029259 [Perkinsus olseni]|uniref:Uncharacterized protein n=1 Tax=Perkinsus olseni TaxID=32597 RepID=A0A7J6T314_PEROL|nr:hypothetical protein FOZ63_029259 [Perkinsus olseni]
MRSYLFAVIAAVAAATEDPCAQMCSDVSGCSDSKYGSYCKSWLSSPVCFGLVKKADGSVCFQPTDSSCVGDSISCGSASTPVVTTTTEPATTTTRAAVSTTTTRAADSTTTTEAAVSTTASTTTEVTATTAASTSATTAEVTATTTTMPPTTVPTTQATTTPTTTASTTSVATTQATTTTTTSTTASEEFGGKYCGNLFGQSFSVDFENGHATVSVLGQSAGADYKVEGTKIVFSNYDPMLQKLMNAFHIKSIDGTIISPTEVHIKAGILIDTTLTSC